MAVAAWGVGSRESGARDREVMDGAGWPRQRDLPGPLAKAQEAAPNTSAQARPRELRNAVALLFAIMLISMVSLLYMHQAGSLATSGYQISQLQNDRDRLQRENQQLEVQLSHLHSLPYVEQVATNKLHMSKGELARVQYVNLSSSELAAAAAPDGSAPAPAPDGPALATR